MNPASHPTPTHKLALNILIKDEQDGQFSATVLGLPEYRVLKSDRTAAISELEKKLAHALSEGEVMALEIEIPQPEHPWQKFAGMYQDSELFESVLENIATHRKQLNEQVVNDRTEDATP
jgi:hypothetical protein